MRENSETPLVAIGDLGCAGNVSDGGGAYSVARKELEQRVKELTPHKCAATMGFDPPQDCNAPYCGCDPAWSECIKLLQECGWKSPDELRELEQRLAEAERDAKRWNAFINGARIRVYGWAGADMEGNKKPGDNYVHFGADFWTNHHPSAVTDPIAKTLITTFADSAIDAAIGAGDAKAT